MQQSKTVTNVRNTETMYISPSQFTATKKSPLLQAGFRIYQQEGKIIVEDVATTKRLRFTLEEGQLNFVTKPNEHYAYFRSNKFQAFLDAHGINRIRSVDPNGEYQLRLGQYRSNVDSFSIITDGRTGSSDATTLAVGAAPILQVRFPSVFATVTDATYVIVQQVTVKQSDDGLEVAPEVAFKLRELITTSDIYNMEDVLKEHIPTLDAALQELIL